MNLVHELAQTPLTWTLTQSAMPSRSNPERMLSTMLLTVVPEPGAQALHKHFRASVDFTTEQMLATLLKEQLKDNPVLRRWLQSKGNVPVKLVLGQEDMTYIGQPVHTGLRKLADTKQSVVTWNGIHKLHPSDRIALWDAVRELLTTAFAQPSKPTRRQLASQLKEAVCAFFENRRSAECLDEKGRPEKRSELEEFALLMMHAGVELTDAEEWMWGWLGYVVEDESAEEEADVEAECA